MGGRAPEAVLAASVYEAQVAGSRPDFPALAHDAEVDVCVVGGGFAGLHTALSLLEAGRSVMLIDAFRIGSGASGRNGGQLIPEFACGEDTLHRALGAARGRACWALAGAGGQGLRARIARYAIDCEFVPGHLEVALSPKRFARLQARHAAAPGACELIGPERTRQYVGSPLYCGGILDPAGGHLQPVKLALGLAAAIARAGGQVHEHTPAWSWRRAGAQVVVDAGDGHELRCRHLVLAANLATGAIRGPAEVALSRRVLPVGTWLIATAPLSEALADEVLPARVAVCDTRMVMDYFRLSRDRRMIFGGGCSYLGTERPQGFAEQMRRRMVTVFPQLEGVPVDHAWGGVLDISMNRAPDFGTLDGDGRVLYAQGFSGSGIVATYVAGQVLCQALQGNQEPLALFQALPHRAFPGGRHLRAPITAAGMLYHRMLDFF